MHKLCMYTTTVDMKLSLSITDVAGVRIVHAAHESRIHHALTHRSAAVSPKESESPQRKLVLPHRYDESYGLVVSSYKFADRRTWHPYGHGRCHNQFGKVRKDAYLRQASASTLDQFWVLKLANLVLIMRPVRICRLFSHMVWTIKYVQSPKQVYVNR
jgi:hypothetical protein